MWVLIQTAPKSRRLAIRMARPWSLVQTLEARPYLTPLAQAAASSSSLNCCTVMTGPKISSWIISSSWRSPETTVGAKKKPRSPTRSPPVTTLAWLGGRGGVLPGVEVPGPGDALGGGLDVGVIEHDDRGLAAQFEVDLLQIVGGGLGHLDARPDRAGDRDHLRDVVRDQGPAGVTVAGDHVEHARGQELTRDLGQAQGGGRGGVGRR